MQLLGCGSSGRGGVSKLAEIIFVEWREIVSNRLGCSDPGILWQAVMAGMKML